MKTNKTWKYTATAHGIDRHGRTHAKTGTVKAATEQDAADKVLAKHAYASVRLVEAK